MGGSGLGPRLAGDAPAPAECQTGEEMRTCQAQVAQHHHISIFIECCRLSNVKLGCYLRMCRFSTNADILTSCFNSFDRFHYFYPTQSEVFKSFSSFPFYHNKDGLFFPMCNPRQHSLKCCSLGALLRVFMRTPSPQSHHPVL